MGGAFHAPVLSSCGARGGLEYRMAGPGRGPADTAGRPSERAGAAAIDEEATEAIRPRARTVAIMVRLVVDMASPLVAGPLRCSGPLPRSLLPTSGWAGSGPGGEDGALAVDPGQAQPLLHLALQSTAFEVAP